MSNKKYIYNWQQANFYIQEGCRVLEIGKHRQTKKIFYVFDWESTKEAYEKWVTKCNNLKN